MTSTTAATPPRATKKRPRGRPAHDAAAGYDSLLKAGLQAFARHGFEAASVRGIAREAGVDPALVMHHFGSKEELWITIVDQIAARAQPMLDAMTQLRTSSLSERQRVEQAVSLLVDRVFAEPEMGTFFSTAAVEQGERFNVLVDKLLRPHRDAFVPLLSDAIQAGVLKKNDPDVLCLMLTSAISRTVSYSHMLATFSSLPRDMAAFRKEVFRTALTMLN
ncbi:TetR family transcriptional regulator [Bordetella genomosp. 10]|uniref:TetR family transcriptional regulator n=1 Tax=Bordetella genomosp. 10 TaxID=1416804 RepID=A0A261S1V2_9BORD|nr:TetR/AcrR family transcriptional regulator [Bordetella genomosp. 10]OZI31145.1 TetR family transcriptional regulator [Bordetella genomosp. 10]